MRSVTSASNPTIKLIRSLAEKKHRQEHELFVAEGPDVLARARTEGWEPVYLLSPGDVPPWGAALRLQADERVMGQVSSQKNPPAVIGVFRQRFAQSVRLEGLWLALEEMRDPGNLGTIIRTADAAGASGIILAGPCCDPYGPDCVRATMGSIFAMPLVKLERAPFIDLLRQWPGETVGTHLHASDSYRGAYSSPTLIVMGSEGKGLSEEAANACATLVRIPMKGGAESLNVAAAAALMLFEVQNL